jgi:hypothetical protein
VAGNIAQSVQHFRQFVSLNRIPFFLGVGLINSHCDKN